MKFGYLLLLVTSTVLAKDLCVSDSPIDELANFALNCQHNELIVTPICMTQTAQGYVTLWTVNNTTLNPCTDNSNFSHNLQMHNLTGTWSPGLSNVCGAFWNGTGNLNLNVAGNNSPTMTVGGTQICSPQQASSAMSACGGITLPIKLKSFTAKFNDSSSCVDIKFVTESEENAKDVVIERSSNGSTFTDFSVVPSKGNQGATYTDSDCQNKAKGKYYYRLRQRDIDGKETSSNVVAVSIEKSTIGTKLFPNPVVDELNVEFDPQGRKTVKYRVVDMMGRTLISKTETLSDQKNGFKFDVKSQAAGMYILQVFDENDKEIHTGKYIKGQK